MRLPFLYAIVDAELLAAHDDSLEPFASQLRAAGVTLLQYRNKTGSPQAILEAAAVLREAFAGTPACFIMNDRADLAVLAGFDGVHVGQSDLSPEDAKAVVRCTITHPSQEREGWATRIVGVSTHTDAQVRLADQTFADYVAVGPVFATGTKADAEPVIGLEGVRRARALTTKPLVAIGGITRANARSVLNAGADSVAVISALIAPGESVESIARDFLSILA
jgi:thiamine-phosphate pyrophosphorylase